MKNIKLALSAALSIGLLVVSSACSSIPMNGGTDEVADDGEVTFIDLDLFDTSMTQNMSRKSPVVTVIFPNQPTTVNNLPERLQRWLSAVHKHGGGIVVETQEGYIQKDLMSVVSILMSGYQLAKKSMTVLMVRQYKAVIVLDRNDGVVGKVNFVHL